ncbi:MAG: GNAT family N-acetyltransferase [Oligoflexia bacterium]|nr:GNAT family N-acetyltransferase [Oligoflexia bacterium]
MEMEGILEAWNAHYGAQLPLTSELLEATFFTLPPTDRFIIQNNDFCLFIKKESTQLRLHLAVPLKTSSIKHICKQAIDALDEKALELEIKKITFGGGDKHLFPGVPLLSEQKPWLEYFSPTGEVVMDFQGSIEELIEQVNLKHQADQSLRSVQQSPGILRQTQNKAEEKELLSFVEAEFKGRWAREIIEDAQNNKLQHYFAYFIKDKIVGYARLYGWNTDYWAPGVYFATPMKGTCGLGPIGVASFARGEGYGSEILKASWEILKSKGCETVRIDWTTELNFYERAGLHVVQKYQPAVRC